ncbi:MAG: hypothetical protein WD851_14005 [Pirellulales bacterium]
MNSPAQHRLVSLILGAATAKWRHASALAMLLTCAYVLPERTAAQIINWNAGTGTWGLAENWLPIGVPNGNTYTYINNGGTAELTGSTGSSYWLLIADAAGTSGRLDIAAGGFAGTALVNLGTGGEGLLNITAGSVVNFGTMGIGGNSGTGIVEINASTLNTSGLRVAGSSGTGRLNVVQGIVNSRSGAIGYYLGNGQATFDEGSHWTISPQGRLEVGTSDVATGVLNILGGSTLETQYVASTIGGYQATTGSGTVTISGMDSKWLSAGSVDINNNGTLNIADNAIAQISDSLSTYGGTLDITGGGVVEVANPTNTTFTNFGFNSGSSMVNVNAGSRLTSSGHLRLGYSGGMAILTISDNATVENVDGEIGYTSGTGIANVNSDGTWKNSGDLKIGAFNSTGTLNVTGGTVENINGFISTNTGGNGAANIGADGLWKNSGLLYVGYGSLGRLDITDGGVVENTHGHLGSFAPANGTANVRSGGIWKNSGHLTVGDQGTGTLNIEGGRVESTRVYVGRSTGSGEVNLAANSLLKITGELAVGYANSADGEVNINGGTVENTEGLIGTVSGAVGTVTVGAGGTWKNSANLNVGGQGTGTVNVHRRGLVTVEDTMYVFRNGTLELGGGSPDPMAATVEADRLQVLEQGVVRGTGKITTPEFINEGTVELDENRTDWSAIVAPRPSETGFRAGLFIQGDFTQRSTGKLSITLDSSIELQPRPAHHSTGLLVNGTATLDGELDVQYAPGYKPDIGDRFALVSANQIVGKIARFDDAIIPDVVNRFLGLNYRSNSNGTEPLLELITLEAPRRLSAEPLPGAPPKRNLLLITHGTNADADSWVTQVGQAMAAQPGAADWQVVAFDWRDIAGGGNDDFKNLPGFDPNLAANNGINIGESLIRWMKQTGQSFDNVHLMAHSAGTWLIDSIADSLKVEELSGNVMAQNVHLTLFDAFTPAFGIWRQDGAPLAMADGADFTEHYFHRHGQVLATDYIHPTAVNVDLTHIDRNIGPIESHAFPYTWYGNTAAHMDPQHDDFGGFGAQLSQIYSGMFPAFDGKLEPNSLFMFTAAPGTRINSIFDGANMFDHPVVATGDVQVLPNGTGILRTQSPAILTSLLEVDQPFWAFQFDLEFLSENAGLLTVYLGDEEVFSFENAPLGIGPGDVLSSGWVWLVDEQAAGPQSIIFRLDPLGAEQASIAVSNLQFISLVAAAPGLPGDFNGNGIVDAADYTVWRDNPGHLDYELWKSNFGATGGAASGDPVPEPATLVLAFVALAASIAARRANSVII